MYNIHVINAYNNLHQGSDESTSVYLHSVQDILECIHHTTDMATISAIGTNHAKILTGLKDGRLCNKLAKSKAKKQTNMSQVLQDIANMAIDFERSCGYLLPTFEVQYISSNTSSSEIGRCSVGGRVSAMCCSILCKSMTGKMCGYSVPDVAALM